MKTTTVLVLSSIVFLSACSADDAPNPSAEAGAIRFETGIQTKGGPVTGTQFASGEKVGVYVIENTIGNSPVWVAPGATGDNSLIMDNLQCTTNGSGGLTYSPIQFYKENTNYSFFAYYPYTDAITAPDAGKAPMLACTFATEPSSQIDYMYASPVENQAATTNACQLKFNHALTQITVKLVNGTNKELTLHSLKVKAPGGATLNIGNGKWTDPTAPADFNLYSSATTEKIKPGYSFSVPNQLMLLPVASGGNAYTFDLSVKEGDATNLVEKPGQTLTLPAGGMKPGYSYEYTITYGDAQFIQLSTSVTEWQRVSGPNINVK